MNPLSIRFGVDEVGPITNRLCDVCDNYVYENLSQDPRDKYDIWHFLCLHCDERQMAFFSSTPKMRRERAEFVEGLHKKRMEAIVRLGHAKAKEREETEQLQLWQE